MGFATYSDPNPRASSNKIYNWIIFFLLPPIIWFSEPNSMVSPLFTTSKEEVVFEVNFSWIDWSTLANTKSSIWLSEALRGIFTLAEIVLSGKYTPISSTHSLIKKWTSFNEDRKRTRQNCSCLLNGCCCSRHGDPSSYVTADIKFSVMIETVEKIDKQKEQACTTKYWDHLNIFFVAIKSYSTCHAGTLS